MMAIKNKVDSNMKYKIVASTLRHAVFATLKPIILLKQTVKAVAMTNGIVNPKFPERLGEAR